VIAMLSNGGIVRVAALVLVGFFATNIGGQDRTVHRPPGAPISCTAAVPDVHCRLARGAFQTAQQTSKAMFSIKVVLADRNAFHQEHDEVLKKLNLASQSNAASREKSNAEFLTPFEHSILFELGEDGLINKVVIFVDLFNEVDVDQLEKTQGRAPAAVHFDRNSAMTWATYVMGYVDGYFSGRTHPLSEAKETTHQK